MGSDPRLDAMLKEASRGGFNRISTLSLSALLAAADQVDRDRGVVRVDTRHDGLVAHLADAIIGTHIGRGYYSLPVNHDEAAEMVRAVLAALTQEDNRGE